MLTGSRKRQISYVFLCATPFVAFGFGAVRSLRTPGVYQVIGVVLFATIAASAWTLGVRAIRAAEQSRRQLALAGTLLIAPFAFVALFWVGMGGPWAATAAENQTRYIGLILMAVLTTSGLVMLREALSEAGERVYSTLGFAAIAMAGPIYIVWDTFAYAAYSTLEHGGEIAPAIVSFRPFQDILLSVAAALVYFATAAFAASLAQIDWLGRKACRAYFIVSTIALTLIAIKIIDHSDISPTQGPPWYAMPGLILSVPALPLIMPSLLGVVMLRRAGNEEGKE